MPCAALNRNQWLTAGLQSLVQGSQQQVGATPKSFTADAAPHLLADTCQVPTKCSIQMRTDANVKSSCVNVVPKLSSARQNYQARSSPQGDQHAAV